MKREPRQRLFFDALTRIGRIDCSTPRCRANGRCTGELLEDPLIGWAAAYHCPDCNSTGLRSTPAVRTLCLQLVALPEAERDAVVARFVASRPHNTRALSAPWQG